MSRVGGQNLPTLRGGGGGGGRPLSPFLWFPRFIVMAWPQRKREGATFSQQSELYGVSARGLSQPKFGQQNEDGTSVPAEMPDVIMTLVSYFCGLPGWLVGLLGFIGVYWGGLPCVPWKARKHWYDIGKVSPSKSQFAETMSWHSLLMPPGKKTLACVFAGANVLGRGKRDYHSVLIYRYEWQHYDHTSPKARYLKWETYVIWKLILLLSSNVDLFVILFVANCFSPQM